MDIKEVWIEFKDRITSPFFGSFIISWNIINWRIPVILIFYKQSELVSGNTTYIDFIQRHSNWLFTLILPVLFAIGYTFLYPRFKRLINVYIAEQTKITDDKLTEVSNSTTVPMNKFIEIRTNLKNQEITLQTLLSDEGKIQADNESLKTLTNEQQANIAELKATHQNTVIEINKADTKRTNDLINIHDAQITKITEDYNNRFNIAQEAALVRLNVKETELSEANDTLTTLQTIVKDKQKEIDNSESLIIDLKQLILQLESSANILEERDRLASEEKKKLRSELKLSLESNGSLLYEIEDIQQNFNKYISTSNDINLKRQNETSEDIDAIKMANDFILNIISGRNSYPLTEAESNNINKLIKLLQTRLQLTRGKE